MQEIVQKYYGETLTGSQDLQTNACCTDASLPDFVKPLLARVHADVQTRYYGCGLVLPELLQGLTILIWVAAQGVTFLCSLNWWGKQDRSSAWI